MRHFSHELKSVLRDHALPLIAPTLVVSGTLYFWIDEWVRTTLPPGSSPAIGRIAIGALVQPIWFVVEIALLFGGWIVPFLLLKNADIHDPMAEWKTRPVSRQAVFGARFLSLILAYVALPATATGLICRASWPDIAAMQSAKVAIVGFGLVLLGAFAAKIAPGKRGIAILAGLAALAFAIATFGPDTAKWILNRHVLNLVTPQDHSERTYEYAALSGEWMAGVALLGATVVVTPWILFRILRPARPPRVIPWFLGVLLIGIGFQAALFLSPERKTPMRGPVLPLATVELKSRRKEASPQIHAMESGYFLGSGNMRLPECDLRVVPNEMRSDLPSMWSDRRGRYQRAEMSGTWATDTLSGRIEGHFQGSRAGVNATWWKNEWGAMPDARCDYSMRDFSLRPLATTLGVPTVKIWTARDCAQSAPSANTVSPVFSWVDSAEFRQKPPLVGFDFGIPFAAGKPGEICKPVSPQKTFSKKTIRFRADMQLAHDLLPTVWFRMPVMQGGEKITDHEMLRVEPAEASDRRFYARFDLRLKPLPLLNRHYREAPRNESTSFLLFNAARGEGVFLVHANLYHRHAPLTLPKNAPPFTDEWIAGAEIVVLKYRSEPVVLPVEGSLKVMD